MVMRKSICIGPCCAGNGATTSGGDLLLRVVAGDRTPEDADIDRAGGDIMDQVPPRRIEARIDQELIAAQVAEKPLLHQQCHRRRARDDPDRSRLQYGIIDRGHGVNVSAIEEGVGRAIVGVAVLHEFIARRGADDEIALARPERVADEADRIRKPSVADGDAEVCRPATRQSCFRSLRPCRSRTACCWRRRRPATSYGRPFRRSAPRPDWPAADRAIRKTAIAVGTRIAGAQPPDRHAIGLVLLGFRRLVFVIWRPAARNFSVRPRLQIGVDIVDVAHHVRIQSERRHDLVVRGVDVLAAVGDGIDELIIGEGLQRIGQRRTERTAEPVGTVADMAIGMIAPISAVGVPVDGPVILHRIGMFGIEGRRLGALDRQGDERE